MADKAKQDIEPSWTGQLDLTVFHNGKRSVARNIFFEKALKVMRPVYLNQSKIPTFYIVNVGGGYLDGDRYRMNINIDNGAAVTLTSQGATKIYKTLSDRVEQYQTFNIAQDGYMEYVADPIIAYENAKFFQHNVFNLKDNASMFYTDILTPGYSTTDKNFTYHYMHLINEIYINEALVTYDNLLMDPNKTNMNSIGYMEHYTHIGSAYCIHPNITQKLIDEVYAQIKDFTQTYDCRLGITQLPTHGFTVRVLSNMTQDIETILYNVQAYIADKLYHRKLDFLRKY
ncbi:urease accessory protein UreD [Staphylococcus lugdunensis]|jgi:urease accessory protein|uniref:urease accessory protein UreD n=1 Tax=Staphylococcus lugdunensis TaxID=28035 RepID=UPI000459B818|nr:urease accessory protein UreD [Staphylococcus lugdunensis]KAK56132.1 urease accessory protein UreD [Staphylococcus lugdunensis VCU150]MCI2845238.1 urease accessory protein UreD [Staphylococcus lugdunensis]MDU0996415.1 urease accessory protein UreD [Staphylococcus lugdunensis]MDU4770112.1 urease accessory protein UreD [Staphylococcus lugdunensis]